MLPRAPHHVGHEIQLSPGLSLFGLSVVPTLGPKPGTQQVLHSACFRHGRLNAEWGAPGTHGGRSVHGPGGVFSLRSHPTLCRRLHPVRKGGARLGFEANPSEPGTDPPPESVRGGWAGGNEPTVVYFRGGSRADPAGRGNCSPPSIPAPASPPSQPTQPHKALSCHLRLQRATKWPQLCISWSCAAGPRPVGALGFEEEQNGEAQKSKALNSSSCQT